MLKISGPIGSALFVTVTLVSATDLSIGSARADNCAAAPSTAAPAGQHWYYHVDRATRHKCWYLHAAVGAHHRLRISHDAAANSDPQPESQTTGAPVAAAAPQAPPAASPEPAAPAPDNAAASAPPAPHVTVLTVKTTTPFVTTTPAPQQNNAANPAVTQAAPRTPDIPAEVAATPASDAEGAAPQLKADAAFGASARTAEAATMDQRTRTAEMFILLAFAFGIAAAVTAIVSKIIGIYRQPRISVDPDAAWLDFRSERQRHDTEAADADVPFLDPRGHYGLADLHSQEWLDRIEADQSSMSPRQNADRTQHSPPPSQGDIEPALRALRQARQAR